MPNFNPYPLDVVNSAQYAQLNAGAPKTAIATICTQLATYRFAATVVIATMDIYDLIDDMVRCQKNQSPVPTLPTFASAEGMVSDGIAQTALGVIRTYLAGITAPTYPSVGLLPLKNAFGLVCNRIVECI